MPIGCVKKVSFHSSARWNKAEVAVFVIRVVLRVVEGAWHSGREARGKWEEKGQADGRLRRLRDTIGEGKPMGKPHLNLIDGTDFLIAIVFQEAELQILGPSASGDVKHVKSAAVLSVELCYPHPFA